MVMSTLLNDMIELLVGGLVGIGEGIGEALSSMVQSIFIVSTEADAHLSTFGSLILIFAGISLGLALTRWVINFLTSLGARNR